MNDYVVDLAGPHNDVCRVDGGRLQRRHAARRSSMYGLDDYQSDKQDTGAVVCTARNITEKVQDSSHLYHMTSSRSNRKIPKHRIFEGDVRDEIVLPTYDGQTIHQ
jgi:uncharacterized protein (UPF0248 family)